MAQKMLDNYLIKKGDHKTLFSLGTSNSQAFGLFSAISERTQTQSRLRALS